jgi:hypothetical protein
MFSINRKYLAWIVVTTLAVALAAFFLMRRRSTALSPVVTQKQIIAAEKSKKSKVWRDILSPKAEGVVTPVSTDKEIASSAPDIEPAESLAIPQEDTSASSVCLSDWNYVASLELPQFEHMIEHGQYSLSPICRESMVRDQEFASVNWFLAKCALAQEVNAFNVERCVQLAFEFRSIAVAKIFISADNYADLDSSVIGNILTRNSLMIRDAGIEQLNQNIIMSEEMIRREPELYGAYKVKLVSMLMKEAKFREAIDETEFETLVSEMSSFVDPDPTIQMRGATLTNELNARLDQLEPQQSTIKNRVEQLNQTLFELQSASKDDVDALNMNEQYLMLSDELEALSTEDERLSAVIAETEDRLEQGEMSFEVGKDPDLVMAPFLRIMIQGDYVQLTNAANDYIDAYPNSPYGYYFLAKALWITGQEEDALHALKSAYVNDSTFEILLKDFKTSANSDPVAYLSNMKLMHNNP